MSNRDDVLVPDLQGFEKALYEKLIVRLIKIDFSLNDVKLHQDWIRSELAGNIEPEAHIRGSLQKLRDKGYIEFLDNHGHYRRRRVASNSDIMEFIKKCSVEEFARIRSAIGTKNKEVLLGVLGK